MATSHHLNASLGSGIGACTTRTALEAGQGDLLILSSSLPDSDRETLVRAATQAGTEVETVQDSDLLEENGGVGCLLRYHFVMNSFLP